MMEKELSIRQVLKHRDAIYGFCALWILFFHVYAWADQGVIYPLTNFISCGNCGVDVFLFLSGLCLCLSFHKKERIHYKDYYKKRAIRVLIPYLLISLPYWIWKSFVEYPEKSISRAVIRILADFSSVSFWLKGTQTTWFVFAIGVFYILFPWMYKCIRKSKKTALFLFMIACLFGAASSVIPVVKNSSIVWARLPVFILGIIAGAYYDQIMIKGRKYTLAIISSFALVTICFFVYSLRTMLNDYKVALWYSYGIIGLAVIACLTVIFQKIGEKPERVFGFIGTLSLELYLVHIPLLHVLRYCGVLKTSGKWIYLIVLVSSFVLACVAKRLCNIMAGRLKG